MGVTNPCCCDLQLGVKIVAVVNMMYDVFWIAISVIGIVAVVTIFNHEDIPWGEVPSDTINTLEVLLVITYVLIILVSLAHFALTMMLYSGAKRRDISRCRIWLIVTVINLVFILIGNVTSASTTSIACVCIAAAVQCYQIWVVYAFMEEVKAEQLQRTAQVHVLNYDYSGHMGPMGYAPYSNGPPPPPPPPHYNLPNPAYPVKLPNYQQNI